MGAGYIENQKANNGPHADLILYGNDRRAIAEGVKREAREINVVEGFSVCFRSGSESHNRVDDGQTGQGIICTICGKSATAAAVICLFCAVDDPLIVR